MLFVNRQPATKNTSLIFTGVTDNQGNEALINQSMTSKFPLYIVLLELTEQLLDRNVLHDLRWQSRVHNQAADDLSNGHFEQFNSHLRINPNLDSLEWKVLPKLLIEASNLEGLIRERKAQRRSLNLDGPDKLDVQNASKAKKRKTRGLRETDPW